MTTTTADSVPEPTASTKPLHLPEKLSYGLGDFASCLYWATFMKYLSYFYTDVFGISAAVAGNMMLISRSTDALFDPIMGLLADRTKTRWGKFRPYFIWMCVPLAIAGVLTFTTPHLSTGGKIAWAIITYNALMLVYTAINIPYTALMGVITTNPLDRTALSSIKYVGAFAGGILIGVAMLPMTRVGGWLGASTEQKGWQMAFIIVGIVACLCFTSMFFTTRERVEPPAAQKTDTKQDLWDLITNGPWLIVVATTLAFIMFVAIPGNTTTYYFKYYVGSQTVNLPSFLPGSWAGPHTWTFQYLVSIYIGINQGASLLGAVLLTFIVRLLGRKTTFMVLMVGALICTGALYFVSPNDLKAIYLLDLFQSITSGPVIALLMTNYADTADYGQWKKMRRATGLIFSASIFSQKIGWAAAQWVGLHLQAASGFVANEVQTPKSLHSLVLLMSLIPCVFGILAMVLFAVYPLNEHRVAEITSELKRRGAGDGSQGEAAPASG